MERQKPWHLYLIGAVVLLTCINILPTLFYYANPLKEPVGEKQAQAIGQTIIERVNRLESESADWLRAYCKLLKIRPQAISLKKGDPGLFELRFQTASDAEIFRRFLPKAGALIPFVPAQLELFPSFDTPPETVLVARQISLRLDPKEEGQLFQFTARQEGSEPAPFYRSLVEERATEIALALGGESPQALRLQAIAAHLNDPGYDDVVADLARQLVDTTESLGEKSAAAQRYFASWTQTASSNRSGLIQAFLTRAEAMQKEAAEKIAKLEEGEEKRLYQAQSGTLAQAVAVVQRNKSAFERGATPETKEMVLAELKKGRHDERQLLSLGNRNPYIAALAINWGKDEIELLLHSDLQYNPIEPAKTELAAHKQEWLGRLLSNEMVRVTRLTGEKTMPEGSRYLIPLQTLSGMQSLLAMDIGFLGTQESLHLAAQLEENWHPSHPDLARDNYPIIGAPEAAETLDSLALVVFSPSAMQGPIPKGFRNHSLYVVARGIDPMMQKYRQAPQAKEGAELLEADLMQLSTILQTRGFISYPGSAFGVDPAFQNALIFELPNFFAPLLKATREQFVVHGNSPFATLEFTDGEQRLLTQNKIDDQIQEELVTWKEEYEKAQVDLDLTRRYEIPPPTKNIYWENFKLTLAKYFRGDDRKILKWGLDLSGGKTVRIGLRDQNDRVITDPEDLNQVVNELYTRINRLGVSERTIRIENNNIILDFPGSQALSAADLIKASSMSFHIINETYSLNNPALRGAVNQFLQEVWNEAVVTNRQDAKSINEIAWKQLGGDQQTGRFTLPRLQAAQVLFDHGLRLANPRDQKASVNFDDTLSRVIVMRGEDSSEWNEQSHPLLIAFNNYALEGSNLTNVQVGYDANEGNILSFGVKGSYPRGQAGNPRDDFYAWTSQFAEEKIAGTPKEKVSRGRGWRMAVVLNDTVISQPTLRGALRDGGTISGRFSQREIAQLAADLKAGSLSFTPRILSEENVSPELGRSERVQGITAASLGLILVGVAMIGYYRFAGAVATCAVLFNLFIMWAVLQNIGAALTLPGIAGIVLTIGMAVDANVLVFERIREEFRISGRLGSAIQAGYKKAFSAIADSNITTIIAALILIQFDSGPIKGFAITLIIGILSSMFTALFMTRTFFSYWIRRAKEKTLTMADWIGDRQIDFLALAKRVIPVMLVALVCGSFLFISQRNTIFGMDFRGGYALQIEVEEMPDVTSYRGLALQALQEAGANAGEVEVRELSRPNQLRIQLALGMEEEGRPFYQMPAEEQGTFAYRYEANPRLQWTLSALLAGGLSVSPDTLSMVDEHWSMMSGQFSEAMRNQVTLALALALASILAYITIRFEWKYAVSAVIALTHDVIMTLGIVALFHRLGFPVQIDLQVIGAIMTIIGYSLNDTIIIFDRVREDVHLMRKSRFSEVVNHALNVTLSRTLMTSGTTFLVLVALVSLGGTAIFGFSLVMTIGVVVGTLSSLFIAAPVMLFFHKREDLRIATASR